MLTIMLTSRQTNLSIVLKAISVEQVKQPNIGKYCYHVRLVNDIHDVIWCISTETDIAQALFENDKAFAYARWGKAWSVIE